MALGSEVLRLDRVGKRYPMGDTVVDALVDASFTLHEGEAVAILVLSGFGLLIAFLIASGRVS